MSDHCYWPLVSDLNNVLSHPPIAFRFMADNILLAMWFDFLKMFQGKASSSYFFFFFFYGPPQVPR
jgi:hypothetical protein